MKAPASAAKAGLISKRDLVGKIEQAVKLADARLKLPGEAGELVVRWDIYGRILRDARHADQFASEVTNQIGALGVSASPALLAIDKKLLAGFIEKIAVPKQRVL